MFSLFRKGKKPAEPAPPPAGVAKPAAAAPAADSLNNSCHWGTHGQGQHDGERQSRSAHTSMPEHCWYNSCASSCG